MTISKTAKAIENLIRKIQDNPLMISREREKKRKGLKEMRLDFA